MNHLIIPTLGNAEDVDRWAFETNGPELLVPAHWIQNGIISDFPKDGCKFDAKKGPQLLIVNSHDIAIDKFKDQLYKVAQAIVVEPSNWAIWWHAGGGNILNQPTGEIKNIWKETLDDNGYKCFAPLADHFPYLYSEDGQGDEWCSLIKNTIRDQIVKPRNTFGLNDAFKKLDNYAAQAEAKYFGFADLKAILGVLLPVYLDLQICASSTTREQTAAWNRIRTELGKLQPVQLNSRKVKDFWLDTLYDKYIPDAQIKDRNDIPDKKKALEALAYVQKVKSSTGKPRKATLEKHDGIKHLFQLLNAQPVSE